VSLTEQRLASCVHVQDLVKRVEETNTELQKYSGVNQRALDQFLDFFNQRRDLDARLKEQVREAHTLEILVARVCRVAGAWKLAGP
jgi:hypothetical protein